MSCQGQPQNFRSPCGTDAESQAGSVDSARGAEDLLHLVRELHAQEQRFLRRLRQGPVPPEVILHLANAQTALRAAQCSFEESGSTSLIALDAE